MHTALAIEFLLGPVVLLSLLRVTAPYGRHFKPGWGLTLPNRLAWVLMELPALLMITIMVMHDAAVRQAVIAIPLALWIIHYGYRSFVFPLLMRPSQKTFPAQLVVYAVAFNLLNGFNNGVALIANAQQPWLTWNLVIGVMIFASGFLIHVQSDAIIRNLRQPGDQAYHVPVGGLFRWVSSPQYLGEIIQWCGWAILTWSLAGLAFALFTACNLVPRAIANQHWYVKTFSDYPRQRKILVPGIF